MISMPRWCCDKQKESRTPGSLHPPVSICLHDCTKPVGLCCPTLVVAFREFVCKDSVAVNLAVWSFFLEAFRLSVCLKTAHAISSSVFASTLQVKEPPPAQAHSASRRPPQLRLSPSCPKWGASPCNLGPAVPPGPSPSPCAWGAAKHGLTRPPSPYSPLAPSHGNKKSHWPQPTHPCHV